MITGFVLAIGAYGLPRLYLNWAAERRVDRIQAGLPDALDMMTMCLTGGMPLQDALERVGTEVKHNYPDVAAEFDIIRRQATAGSMGQVSTCRVCMSTRTRWVVLAVNRQSSYRC